MKLESESPILCDLDFLEILNTKLDFVFFIFLDRRHFSVSSPWQWEKEKNKNRIVRNYYLLNFSRIPFDNRYQIEKIIVNLFTC